MPQPAAMSKHWVFLLCALSWLAILPEQAIGHSINLDGTNESIQLLLDDFLETAAKLKRSDPPLHSGTEAKRRPNIVLILTDDQDLLLNSTHPAYMPAMHKHIASKGLWMRSYSASTSVCCPSRVNLLTGRFTHNHNVTSNVAPKGGYVKFQETAQDHSYLPTWLQDLGYRTYFTGKFLNGFNPVKDRTQKCPDGWTVFEPMMKPYVMHYWDSTFLLNCGQPYNVNRQYSTDVLLSKTLGYIKDAMQHPDQPFYIHVNPIAPHESCGRRNDMADTDTCNNPPVPAARHAHMYTDVPLPTAKNFGVPPPNATFNWVDVNTPLRSWKLHRMLDLYQQRLRAVRAVDDMIDITVKALDAIGELDNTYFIFMSDNGFKVGAHGVYKGKLTAYEEDVRVPFFIRGPGISEGVISDYQGTMCDVPATIVDLAGGTVPAWVDGSPLPLKHLTGYTPIHFHPSVAGYKPSASMQGLGQLDVLRDQVPHEMWVWGSDKRLTGKAYRAVRICSTHLAFGSPAEYRQAAAAPDATFGFRLSGTVPYSNPGEGLDTDTPITCYKYVVWCTGTLELYDLMLDPWEVHNRFDVAPAALLHRLDAYLTVQGFCRGRHCSSPYSVLHPDGGVTSFADAMQPAHDQLYAGLPVFRFKQCLKWYYPENEAGWLVYDQPSQLSHLDGSSEHTLGPSSTA